MFRFLTVVSLFLPVLVAAQVRASCVDGGCHQRISEVRYIHGPVAVESFGQKGCALCHVSKGPACTDSRGGAFALKTSRKQICTSCHDAGNGTRHTGSQGACLSCHNPHGSDRSAQFLKNG